MSGNKFWSTNLSRKRDDCQIMLVYKGGLTFSDTVSNADMQRYRLEHPTPPPPSRDSTPPPPPHEETQSMKATKGPYTTPKPKPKPKPGRHTLNSLLAGVTNPKKMKQIIRNYAKSHNIATESEKESEFENKKQNGEKPKYGKLNIKDFVIRRRGKKTLGI